MSSYSRLESPGRRSNIRFAKLGRNREGSPTHRSGPPAAAYDDVDAAAAGSSWCHQPGGGAGRYWEGSAGGNGSGSADDEVEGRPPQARVKVVIQGEGDEEAAAERDDPVLMSRGELEEMIVWETNNLYDYLKGLFSQGLEEAQAGHEFDKEAWEQRMAHLRRLLQQRDAEVEELQRLLEEREDQLGERDAHVLRQAELIRSQAAQIRDLLRQAEQCQRRVSSSPRGGLAADYSAEAEPVAARKKAALPQAVVRAESHFVRLPPQQSNYLSYSEYAGCGLWQAVVSSWSLHRKRWVIGGAAALLLLLIILLATLIPASRNKGPQAPRFLQPPAVTATGASFFDVTVQLDRPAVVSYMLFRTSNQLQQVPGTGRTLLDLIQSREVSGDSIFDASSLAGSLGASKAQPGLQQLAAACGWAPVLVASQNERVTLSSVASAQSAACTSSDVPRKCARCPRIVEGDEYTILLVAATPDGGTVSDVQVLNSVAETSAVNINSANPPYATNVTANSFVLNVQLNMPGTIYYAVLHDSFFTQYGAYNLAFEALAPSSSDVLAADPALFAGGLVANGSFEVPAAREWVAALVRPPCVAALCQQSSYGLLGGTPYKVFLVSVDLFGTVDPGPMMVSVTTLEATSGPALLPASGPTAITANSFGVGLSMDSAGGAYYYVLAAKPGAAVAEPEVQPGNWTALPSLPGAGGRRRLLSDAGGGGGMIAALTGLGDSSRSRSLLEDSSPAPGSLFLPTCYPANRTCQAAPASVFASVPGLAAFDVVASGCAPAPAAGRGFSLPPSTGLQNNSLYYVLVATEDLSVPSPIVQRAPAVFAVRTVDLSASKLACGFPTVTNITASGFAVSAMLTKPAWAFYVVLPTSQAGTAPSAVDILQGQGAGGQGVAAAGNMTRSGSLPWETGGALDRRKLWASATGLQSGISYTVFITLSLDGNTPVSGSPVARVSDVFTPATVAPTFTSIQAANASVDEASGTFSLSLNATLDRPGVVFYALYRAYSCISGEPSVADILSGGALPAGICPCSEPWYCSLVTAGNFSAGAAGGAGTVAGGLAPLPFEELRNAPESQLRCFRGGLGQATDTYNIYLVAGSSLPTYTGLAPQCSNFAQAAATAAAAAPDGSCTAAPTITCSQAQARPDVRIMQSAPMVAWPQQGSGGAGSGVVSWAPAPGANVNSRPAKVQLSLEGGEPPAFIFGPDFPAAAQLADGLFVQFKLTKPALVIYAVRSFPVFDPASNDFPAPVLVSTGRVPVFDAAQTYNTTIRACSGQGWPAGPLARNTQYSVQYVARDKYGRMDGPCPAAHPSCLDTATTLA